MLSIQMQLFNKQYVLLNKRCGFSLVEMLVALVIAIILAAVAIPQFISATQAQRTSSEINNLLNDVSFARSEAMKEGQMVSLCISSNGTSCGGTSWNSGWIVYSNPSWTAASPGFTSGTSVLLRVQPGFTTTDTIVTTPLSTTTLTFNRDGFSVGLPVSGLLFKLSNSTNNSSATRCLWVDVLGRSYVQKSGAPLAGNGQSTACS